MFAQCTPNWPKDILRRRRRHRRRPGGKCQRAVSGRARSIAARGSRDRRRRDLDSEDVGTRRRLS